MKNKGRLVIAIALLLSLATPLQAATPKAGAKCTKVGSTATASGKKFTCIKSGTKLVWNKGVTIKTAAPKPTPTAEGDPIGAIGGTPSPAPTATQTTKALTPLEKLNSDIYQRYLVAQKNISPSFNFVRCPNANKEMADMTEKAYIDAYSFYVPIYNFTLI